MQRASIGAQDVLDVTEFRTNRECGGRQVVAKCGGAGDQVLQRRLLRGVAAQIRTQVL
jgi:hypothetical protein